MNGDEQKDDNGVEITKQPGYDVFHSDFFQENLLLHKYNSKWQRGSNVVKRHSIIHDTGRGQDSLSFVSLY